MSDTANTTNTGICMSLSTSCFVTAEGVSGAFSASDTTDTTGREQGRLNCTRLHQESLYAPCR